MKHHKAALWVWTDQNVRAMNPAVKRSLPIGMQNHARAVHDHLLCLRRRLYRGVPGDSFDDRLGKNLLGVQAHS